MRAAIPPDDLSLAERVLVAPRRDVEPGAWSPQDVFGGQEGHAGGLVLSGIVMETISLAGRCSANLLGPGDIVRVEKSRDTVLPCNSVWTCLGAAAVAVLDDRFLAAARRWPRLSAVVHDRLADQLDRAMLRTAIVSLPRVEQRVLALFWLLADRWGIVRPGGVAVRLPLTHELIGQLVAAQRPTVSLALQSLAGERLLWRNHDGAWTLDHGSHQQLAAAHLRAA
jgi:CRP-like cAMP-binding protein